jgi:hypothetical protein
VKQRFFLGTGKGAFRCAKEAREKKDINTKTKVDSFNAVNLDVISGITFGKKFKRLNYD